MKKIYMLALALIVLFSMTMSVEAQQQKTITIQNGTLAYAEWISKDLTTDTVLFVTQWDLGTSILFQICNSTYLSCKSGGVFTQDNVFSIDKKLDYASLKSVTMEMTQSDCYLEGDVSICTDTPAGTATIDATWTGIGKVNKSSSLYISKSGDFRAKGSSDSLERMATANNEELGTSDIGGLSIYKYVDIQITK
jgi:hypothetical protein